VSERGVRLNIRKATLREWRRDFAEALRKQGVAANATERAVRGVSRSSKSDGIYRAMRRGDSTHLEERTINVASELRRGLLREDPGAETLGSTRRAIEQGWRAVSTLLEGSGERELARHVRQFVAQMPPAQTDREWIATKVIDGLHQKRREQSHPTR